MQKVLAFVAVIGLIGMGSARAEDLSIDPDQWAKLLTRIVNQGERYQNDIYVGQSVSKLEPDDKTKSHRMSAVTAAGRLQDNKFIPRSTSVVIEDWTLAANGDWKIDQWIYEANLDGDLARASHYQIDEASSGRILNYQAIPANELSDDVVKAQYKRALTPWLSGQY